MLLLMLLSQLLQQYVRMLLKRLLLPKSAASPLRQLCYAGDPAQNNNGDTWALRASR